jgi:hypothetical protein
MRVSFAQRNTKFSWRAIPGVNSYTLNYRKSGTANWTSVSNISTNSKSVKNLSKSVQYQWRVSASCNEQGNWSRIIGFVAGDNSECPKTASMNASNYGETLNLLQWSPSSNAESYTIRVRATDSSAWSINHTNRNFLYVPNLDLCSGYEFQVESNCPATTSGFSSSYNFTSSGCCTQPGTFSVNDISDTSANAAWSPFWPSTNAVKYHVRIKEKSASGWVTDSTTNTTFNYTNLSACTDYEFEIESVCENSLSGYTSATSFKTTGCTSACDAPSGLFVSNINKKNARLNWDAVSGASSYEAVYWAQGSSSVKTLTTTSTQVNLNGLNINTTYEWKVRANCSSIWSDYSTTESFVAGFTGSSTYVQEDEQNLSEGNNLDKTAVLINFTAFPNPTTGILTINFESTGESATHVSIMDMQGRVLMQLSNDMGNIFSKEVDISHFANGMYLIYVYNNNAIIKSAKILKSE